RLRRRRRDLHHHLHRRLQTRIWSVSVHAFFLSFWRASSAIVVSELKVKNHQQLTHSASGLFSAPIFGLAAKLVPSAVVKASTK
uniref:Uncharacterized protein n=1 Tax=Oryza brachyantha TaxID=4533 RepID=J3MPB9_ORYBR